MKNKKTASANLESKRLIFFQIGIIISLAVALTAFEWKSYETHIPDFDPGEGFVVKEVFIPPTVVPKKPEPVIKSFTDYNTIDDEDDELGDEDLIDLNPIVGLDDEIPEWEGYDLPEEDINEEPVPIVNLDRMPEFPGGDAALMKFLARNLKYPIMAVESGVQGRVYVQFIVEKDGSITDVKLMRGIGAGCDEEAIRVVNKMPKWKPGKQNYRTVRVIYTLPVRFLLN